MAVGSYYGVGGGKVFVSAFIIPLAALTLIALATTFPMTAMFRRFTA